jgi:hypothetical protein
MASLASIVTDRLWTSGIQRRHATGAGDVPFLGLARHFGDLSSLARHATIVVIKAMRDNDEDF